MTTVDILTAARALIEPPESWCQKTSAVDEDGCPSDDLGNAVARCGLGSIWTICGMSSSNGHQAENILALVARDRGFANFPKLNDDPATTHAMVLDAFDAAIEKARSDG